MNQNLFDDVSHFLQNNFVAVLATSYSNLPYASIIYYAVDDKLNFYFVTKMNTDKYLNLKINKNVAIVIGNGPKHISVQVRGHATILNDEKKKDQILKKIQSILKKQKIEVWPIKKLENLQAKKKDLDGEIVYKVIPQHLSFTNLDDQSLPNSISNKIRSIIPLPKK